MAAAGGDAAELAEQIRLLREQNRLLVQQNEQLSLHLQFSRTPLQFSRTPCAVQPYPLCIAVQPYPPLTVHPPRPFRSARGVGQTSLTRRRARRLVRVGFRSV